MPRCFEIGPMTLVVGNVTLQFGYDPNDHSLCKMLVTASGAQSQTEVVIPRNGNQAQIQQLSAVVAADQQAIAQQIAQGGPVGSANTNRATIVVY
jgi:hypothetical protein